MTSYYHRRKRKRCVESKIVGSKVWNDLRVEHTSLISSFLNLEEKVAVRSLNKAWLEGATLDHKVSINAEEVGTNLDGAIEFVINSFPNLRYFSLNAELSGDGGRSYPVELHGHMLQRLFQNRSGLRSVSLSFGLYGTFREYPPRILVEEEGLATLHQQTSLQSLVLSHPYFDSMTALSNTIRPLTNLEHFRLIQPSFSESEYSHRNDSLNWRDPSGFIATLATLPKLRGLCFDNHGFKDDDIVGLAPILPQITELELDGRFENTIVLTDNRILSQPCLTDASMAFIAENCPKLQSLSVCFNKRITMNGFWQIIRKCPLQQLQASITGLKTKYLKDIVEARPTLRLIRYGENGGNHIIKNVRDASIASQGRVVFSAMFLHYEPEFDPNLMANHYDAIKHVKDLQKNHDYEIYNDWKSIR